MGPPRMAQKAEASALGQGAHRCADEWAVVREIAHAPKALPPKPYIAVLTPLPECGDVPFAHAQASWATKPL